MMKTSNWEQNFKKYAWRTLFGFSIMYAFLYTGRLNMGLVLPIMTKELGWSLFMAGTINSILFWTYGIGNLINGRLGEIIGTKRFIMAGILLSVLTNWAISFLTGAVAIAILWGLNGFFQSMAWPPGISMLSKWWTKDNRGFAAGFANSFSGAAQVIVWLTAVTAIDLMPAWGWRAVFRLPVILLLSASFIYWYMVTEKPSDVGLPDYEEEDTEAKKLEEEYGQVVKENGNIYPYLVLFSQKQFIIWCAITALSSVSQYGLLTWIPLYFVNVMQINIKSGIISSVLLPAGMAIGTFAAPWATDKFFKTSRMPMVIICGVAGATAVFIFPHVASLLPAAFILFVVGFFVYGVNGVVWAFAMDVGGRVFSGTAAGILQWAAYMGVALQAIIFGYILDKTGNWMMLFGTVALSCVLMAVLPLILVKVRRGIHSETG